MTHIFDLVKFYNSCLNKVSKINQDCNLPKVSKKVKKIFFVHSIKMSNLRYRTIIRRFTSNCTS